MDANEGVLRRTIRIPFLDAPRVQAHGSRLAWRLAGELVGSLAEEDKTAVYVELGAGEIWSGVHRMLRIAARDGLVLSADLKAQLGVWLDGYAGSIEEPLVRRLLTRIRHR